MRVTASARGLARVVPLLLVVALAAPGRAADRREQYRALAAAGLGQAAVPDAERALHELLDAEILDSLAGGSVFGSPAFIRERLEGLADAWGGASLEVARAGPLTIGAFHLGEDVEAGVVRVYGPVRGAPGLVETLAGPGRPRVHAMAPGPAGQARLLIAWEGRAAGPGLREFRLDLLRAGRETVEVGWSTATLAPDALRVRSHTVRGGEVTLRYALAYPGWVPGCEGQTEREDVWRFDPRRDTMVLVRRRDHDAWHREVGHAAARLLAALAAGDAPTLSALVPGPGLRRALPGTLVAEPACHWREGPAGGRVAVAALELPERRPWTLVFGRQGDGWRLLAASPVLQ